MRRTLSWILALITLLTGLAVAMTGFGTAFTSWDARVPDHVRFDVGNAASVDRAMLETTEYWQDTVGSHYTDPLLLTSAMLLAATTVLAIVFVRGWRASGPAEKPAADAPTA